MKSRGHVKVRNFLEPIFLWKHSITNKPGPTTFHSFRVTPQMQNSKPIFPKITQLNMLIISLLLKVLFNFLLLEFEAHLASATDILRLRLQVAIFMQFQLLAASILLAKSCTC